MWLEELDVDRSRLRKTGRAVEFFTDPGTNKGDVAGVL